MPKSNKINSNFIEYTYVAPVKEIGGYMAQYKNQAGEVVIQAIEKTKAECQRVLEFRLKAQRKLDKVAPVVEAPAPKAKKGWNAARTYDFAKDECECSKCKGVYSFADFYNDKSNRAGVQNLCKSCLKEVQKVRKLRIKAEKAADAAATINQALNEILN